MHQVRCECGDHCISCE
jgi:hypothetical protein